MFDELSASAIGLGECEKLNPIIQRLVGAQVGHGHLNFIMPEGNGAGTDDGCT
jgi:hypothetical protein